MRVHLTLKCEDRFAVQARYVFSTFCKVLGFDLVENELDSSLTDGPTVWYGVVDDAPTVRAGLVCIHASPDAIVFFESHYPRCIEEVTFTLWGTRRVPFLFATQPESVETRRLDSLLGERPGGVYMPYDLIASAFYFLSQWEETVIPDRDSHGRFPYDRALATQLNLSENIVDIYLDLFIALLNTAGNERWPQVKIPTWPGAISFVACLTHDVDVISKSRLSRLKFMWDHLIQPTIGHRQTPLHERAYFALKTLFDRQDPYWTFPALVEMERVLGFTASYYFQAGKNSSRQNYYSLLTPPVCDFITHLRQNDFEVGLHGTYLSAFDEEAFLQEKATLTAAVGEAPAGHRQHYLRMDYAITLPIYERAELQYDATLGYAEHEGYRNQFSYPYQPFNHKAGRPFRFLELPTVIMDATLGGYRNMPAADAWRVIVTWLERTCTRQGCITILWHNPWDGVFPGYFNLYPKILTWIREHSGQGLAGRDVLYRWQMR